MKQDSRRNGQGRRDFLKLAGLGAVAGTAAAAGAALPVRAEEAGGRKGAGYRVTEHVRKAYELARF